MRDKGKMHAAQKRWYRDVVKPRRERWLRENGPCVDCGSWKDPEVDHVDPSTKDNHAVWTWSEERRAAELKKCVVRCHECHKKKSADECHRNMIGKPNLPCRKLTAEQVLAIRQSPSTEREISKQFRVGKTTIHSIRASETYREIGV